MVDVYLPPQSQKRLLEIARKTLCDFVRGNKPVPEQSDDPYLTSDNYGAFVSLYKGDELRGCVGTCSPRDPLYKIIIDMTEAAASRDRRMTPVSRDELEQIRLDITVISPLVKTAQPLTLEVGKHGLLVARGRRRAVLLPQVATEHGWEMEMFLAETCLKAGLRRDDWRRSDTEISAFTALILEEKYETA